MHHADHARRTNADRTRILWTGDVRGDQTRIVAIDPIAKEGVSYSVHRYCDGCGSWHGDIDIPAWALITALIDTGTLKL